MRDKRQNSVEQIAIKSSKRKLSIREIACVRAGGGKPGRWS